MKKIVLIDDDKGIRESTVDILELSGYRVFTSENGKKGIKLIKKVNPDIILCDINMPDLNGYDVLRIINRIPETANIPFVFLSSNSATSDIRKGMNLGADDYLTKPFKEIDLLDAIEIRIKRRNHFKKDFNTGIDGVNKFIDIAHDITPLKEIYKNKIRKHYAKNEIIFKENDHINFVYYIVSGKVKRLKLDSHGKEFLNDFHYENDFFGYLNLFKGENGLHQRTAIASKNSEIALIPKEDFKVLINQNREVASAFIKLLSGNVLDKEERLLHLAYASVRERVASILIKLEKENKSTIIQISRDDLANTVGTSKESLIRTLSEFKKENLIRTERATIVILDEKQLFRIADGF